MTTEEMIDRCRQIPGEIEDHKRAMVRLSTERIALLQALRESGIGLGQLAELMGISRGRAQQLTW